MVLVSAYVPETRQPSYRLGELAELKLVLPSRIHALRLIVDRPCKERAVTLKPKLELDSLNAVKALLAKRPLSYFTILPSHGVKQEVENRQFSQYDIDDPGLWRTIAVVTPLKARNDAITAHLQRRIVERAKLIKSTLNAVA